LIVPVRPKDGQNPHGTPGVNVEKLTKDSDVKSAEKFVATLCMPDHEKSCFACCPPIRQAGYEHIQHKKIVERLLRENTRAFDIGDGKIMPITGFSCWALGYLDKDCRLVGCLLHPARNKGKDMRYLVDYGDKCRRETCPEAETFTALQPVGRRFWLSLAKGLDSFSYSSREKNPLFDLLGWGEDVLTSVSSDAGGLVSDRDSFFETFPFFVTGFSSKAHRYILLKILRLKGTGILKKEPFRERFESFIMDLLKKLRSVREFDPRDPYVHRLEIDRGFSDFLRLSVGVSRINPRKAGKLEELTDKTLQRFCSGL
jgi:hypothetical protein